MLLWFAKAREHFKKNMFPFCLIVTGCFYHVMNDQVSTAARRLTKKNNSYLEHLPHSSCRQDDLTYPQFSSAACRLTKKNIKFVSLPSYRRSDHSRHVWVSLFKLSGGWAREPPFPPPPPPRADGRVELTGLRENNHKPTEGRANKEQKSVGSLGTNSRIHRSEVHKISSLPSYRRGDHSPGMFGHLYSSSAEAERGNPLDK